MKPREFDPRRLNMRAFARAGGRLDGRWPLAGFERLRDLLAVAAVDGDVAWQAEGSAPARQGGASETWLHLDAEVMLPLRCQRCLEVVGVPMQVDRRYLFVADEAEAARLDAELDDEVLVMARELDLHELLEDELLLELPLVPRHADCTAPGQGTAVGVDAAGEPTHKPFEALQSLRRGRG